MSKPYVWKAVGDARSRHTGKLSNFLAQSDNAEKTMLKYRERMMLHGFRFVGDSMTPPANMKVDEAMKLSAQAWAEVNSK